MGDYYSGSISIGGQIRREWVEEFLETLTKEDVTLEWGGDQFCPTSMDELLAGRNADGHLHFQNSELRNGCYEALEKGLITHHLSFIRWSSSYGEYTAEVVHCRNGQILHTYCTDDQKNILIHEHRVERACIALEHGRPDLAYRLLRSALPTHLPALPPFTIARPSRQHTPPTQHIASHHSR